jgi:sialate O-acetylesterase
MKSSRLFCAVMATVMALQISARADLKLPAVFGDNMVLQQQKPVPVWGWSAPGAKVTVKFAGQSQSTVANANGKWLVKLDKLKASFTPQTLVVEAGETKTFTNILVGEVWLASGQSNMEMPVQGFQKPTINADVELAAANYPAIRLLKVEKMTSAKPRTYLEKYYSWRECSPFNLTNTYFSAAAYFFGRELHTNLHVPVGIISSSWGGTRIEPWTPPVGFESVPSLAHIKPPTDLSTNKTPQREPSALYNAMIAPFAGCALRGAIWYQGEANRGETNYDAKMSALIGGWRKVWNQGDFPFYFVQIAPYTYMKNTTNYIADKDPLPRFWLQQSRAARHIKNTGMVVTTDLVDDLNDIHPRNKKDVGHRLALLALDETYGREVPSESLALAKMQVTGNQAVLKFSNTYGGLKSRDGQPLTWFEVAGADGKFVSAEAKIVGETVVVSAAGIDKPKAVRFAWNQIAQPNLCNQAGLPAEPFNTQMPVE